MNYGFQNNLVAEKIAEANSGGRAEWRLREDLIYQSELVGLIIVPAGYETDFASVPRLPLAYWLTGDTAHASAVVHDYLCSVRFTRGDITWRAAAEVFDEAMKCEGVPAWRRWLMVNGVMGADPANKTEVMQ
jgi:hypothetical protein